MKKDFAKLLWKLIVIIFIGSILLMVVQNEELEIYLKKKKNIWKKDKK